MAFRKQLVLPFAALLFSGIIAANAGDTNDLPEISQDKATDQTVAEELAEGEAALEKLLGDEVQMLDSLLKPMIRDLANTYGVSEKELSKVAKEVMQKIATMDMDTLQATLGQLSGLGGVDLNSMASLQDLLGKMDSGGSSGDGI